MNVEAKLKRFKEAAAEGLSTPANSRKIVEILDQSSVSQHVSAAQKVRKETRSKLSEYLDERKMRTDIAVGIFGKAKTSASASRSDLFAEAKEDLVVQVLNDAPISRKRASAPTGMASGSSKSPKLLEKTVRETQSYCVEASTMFLCLTAANEIDKSLAITCEVEEKSEACRIAMLSIDEEIIETSMKLASTLPHAQGNPKPLFDSFVLL